MNKKLLIIPAAALIVGGLSLSTTQASAFNKSFSDHPMISKIAEKFGLDEAEVQGFMEEQREAKQAEMQEKFMEKLNAAIADGKLTQEQKELILQKHEEMKNRQVGQKENMHDLTPEEREVMREERQAEREGMELWLEENGIDGEYFGHGNGFNEKNGGPGRKMGRGK
jgi:hypothetical protein